MILILPSINLSSGKCIDCIIGESGTENIYNNLAENPDKLIKLFRKENAKSVFVNDVDSLCGDCQPNIEAIKYITSNTDIPIQYHADFTNIQEIINSIDSDVYRVIIPCKRINLIQEALRTFSSSKIVAAIEITNDSFLNENDEFERMLDSLKNVGVNRIYLNIVDGGHLKNDLDYIIKIHNKGLKITYNSQLTSSEELWKVNEYIQYGLDSIVVGKSIYENNFPCQKIWRLIEAELQTEII